MKRITTGITWAQLTKHAVTASAEPRPDAPKNSITYRCGASIYVHKSEWRGACSARKNPGAACACNQPQESEAAA